MLLCMHIHKQAWKQRAKIRQTSLLYSSPHAENEAVHVRVHHCRVCVCVCPCIIFCLLVLVFKCCWERKKEEGRMEEGEREGRQGGEVRTDRGMGEGGERSPVNPESPSTAQGQWHSSSCSCLSEPQSQSYEVAFVPPATTTSSRRGRISPPVLASARPREPDSAPHLAWSVSMLIYTAVHNNSALAGLKRTTHRQ